MKLAYYSPMPPERSGIADYSALLLPELRERIDVEVVKRGRRRAPRGADVALYHVGNDPARTPGSSTRCASGRASSSCTTSSSTTSSPG